jgi:hypothetical protein
MRDDKPGALQCRYELLGNDASHNLVGAVRPLATVELQRVGDRLGQVLGLRGCELRCIGRAGSLAAETERSKNGMVAC